MEMVVVARNDCYRVVPHKDSIVDHDSLEKDFTNGEVFIDSNYLQNGKSPRVNGVPYDFYKAMWDIVTYHINHLASNTFSSMCLIQFINQALINIILENAHRDTIGGWEPITSLSVAYKIIDKVVVLQVKDAIKNIVHKEHIGFVQGIFTLDKIISSWKSKECARDSRKQTLSSKFIFTKPMTGLTGP